MEGIERWKVMCSHSGGTGTYLDTSFVKKNICILFFLCVFFLFLPCVVRSNLELDPDPQRLEFAMGQGSDLPHVEVVPIYTEQRVKKLYNYHLYSKKHIRIL